MSAPLSGSGIVLPQRLRARRAFLLAGTLFILLISHVKARAASADAPAPTVATERVLRSWPTEDGLPQDSVNAIVRTRDGFLWVGTNAGLARLAGVHFRTFGLQNGLRSVLISALAEDWVAAGSSWLATDDALPPDHHVLRVTAADSQGNWNEPGASLAFSVQPSFWQSTLFRAGVTLLLVGAGGTAAWLHQRRKHRRHLAELERERKLQSELFHASRVTLLGELSASLAHELKQPLAAILSNAQAGLRFLNDNPADISEVRDILKDIAESDRRASEIISRTRTMMKKGATQMEARDLNADVQQALQLVRGELAARNVTVDMQLSPDLPSVRGDHIQLQQVLLNLVINGCDAMHANEAEERRLVIETARDGDDFVRISISDRGGGIAPEMLEHIFEPFYSTKDSGLGMGLAICRAIINAHGGRLWAANNPGRGATFHLALAPGGQKQP